MKLLSSSSERFDQNLDKLLLKRKKRIRSSEVSVLKIINDVKKNKDKAILKYEKKFNKNKIIIPSKKNI